MKNLKKVSLIAGISLACVTGWVQGDEKAKAEAAVDQFRQYDMAKIEETVKAFLKSESIEERARFIRHPKRVKPLMKKFYGGEKMAAEGFESFNQSEVSYRGSLLTAIVETGDFLETPIAVEQVGKGDKATYLVDWESWVGFCELKPEEMHRKKPVTPTEMRVILSLDSYYNFHFSDEKKWKSYLMELRNSESTFQGYVKRGSEVEKSLLRLKDRDVSAPYLVKVVYPPEAKSKGQVEIVEVICSGWIFEATQKKK